MTRGVCSSVVITWVSYVENSIFLFVHTSKTFVFCSTYSNAYYTFMHQNETNVLDINLYCKASNLLDAIGTDSNYCRFKLRGGVKFIWVYDNKW